MGERFSHAVNHFHGRALPEPAIPAGYAALIDTYGLQLPLPPRLAAIVSHYHPKPHPEWLLLTPRHAPTSTLAGQLGFALKWEGVDLAVLAALFKVVPPASIADIVRSKPNSIVGRRLWFLYEWLRKTELDVPPLGKVRMASAVDDTLQFALVRGESSGRHKIVNNLPGTPAFCPMVRRTPALSRLASARLDVQARAVIGKTRRDVLLRAAAFLSLSDSRSSFAIEGEKPAGSRMARWGQTIAEAGHRTLSVSELERLQRLVLGDDRFVRFGVRTTGGFIGEHDRITSMPMPDHVSARPDDLHDLLAGIIAYDERARAHSFDPVVAAATAAFGFVYVHPFIDGNGRLHRWLMHHVLAMADYNPPGLIFPISAVILRRIDDYRDVLESYSRPLLPFIDWRTTNDGNVEVLNATADYYRYFDATAHAELLYMCVEQTVEHDLPNEVTFLERFDRFKSGVKDIVEMSDRDIERLRGFLDNGHGTLSQRARTKEFAALTDDERVRIEELYAQCCFAGW